MVGESVLAVPTVKSRANFRADLRPFAGGGQGQGTEQLKLDADPDSNDGLHPESKLRRMIEGTLEGLERGSWRPNSS